MRKTKLLLSLLLIIAMLSSVTLSGCSSNEDSGKIEIELVQYKPEAVAAFEKIEEGFNATHDDIHLTIQSPNEAMTILKTRFIREDYPDIVGIGGDINYSNFLDADMFMDLSDFEGVDQIKQVYMDMEDQLELIPTDGIYALPYAANAAGVLYNKDMFEEHGWQIPTTWDEFIQLCQTIQEAGICPLYFGYKDTWTCLSPWNALAGGLAPSNTCSLVNSGETTFSKEYFQVAERMQVLMDYCEPNPFAYGYNDACTAFARGQSAMYPIGSYAVPQIKSVNPDMNIDSFVLPTGEKKEDNILTSGVDLQFCVMKNAENKDAIYEVLRYLYQDETIQIYLDDQNAIPCKEGDFQLPSMLDGMSEYIQQGRMADFQDHHYPSEMSVDAMIQTYLLDDSENATAAFLQRFDEDWVRYNRDLIEEVRQYEEDHQ